MCVTPGGIWEILIVFLKYFSGGGSSFVTLIAYSAAFLCELPGRTSLAAKFIKTQLCFFFK